MKIFTYSENDRQKMDRIMRLFFIFQYLFFIPFFSALAVLHHSKYLIFDPVMWLTMIFFFLIPGCIFHGIVCRLMKNNWAVKLILDVEAIVWEFEHKRVEIPFSRIRKIRREENSQGELRSIRVHAQGISKTIANYDSDTMKRIFDSLCEHIPADTPVEEKMIRFDPRNISHVFLILGIIAVMAITLISVMKPFVADHKGMVKQICSWGISCFEIIAGGSFLFLRPMSKSDPSSRKLELFMGSVLFICGIFYLIALILHKIGIVT